MKNPTTHFIEFEAPRLGRQKRALCGALVESSLHAAQPTCDECRRRLAEDEAQISLLQQQAGR